jgi:lipopolysaccharide transport system permease protein
MDPAAPRPPRAETVIKPAKGWRSLDLGEIFTARELLGILTWRDVKVRYKQTILGAVWAQLQPALLTVVFSFVLQRWAKLSPGDLPFALHVYTGMWVWVFFSTALTTSANSVVGAERVVTKVYFPRLTIPFAAVLASLVDFVIATAGFLVLALIYGVTPGWGWLLAPVLVALLALLAMGLGAGMAALMVVFRDVRYVLPFVVQLLLFATPSIYLATTAGGVEANGAAEQVSPADEAAVVAVEGSEVTPASDAEPAAGGPEATPASDPRGRLAPMRGTGLLYAHPLDGLVASFRAAMLGGIIPWGRLGAATIITLLVFMGGCLLFRRLEDTFADVI